MAQIWLGRAVLAIFGADLVIFGGVFARSSIGGASVVRRAASRGADISASCDFESALPLLFQVDPSYKLTKKQKKHRIMIFFEKLFGLELSKKHFKLVK